jgi:hypothetical protein
MYEKSPQSMIVVSKVRDWGMFTRMRAGISTGFRTCRSQTGRVRKEIETNRRYLTMVVPMRPPLEHEAFRDGIPAVDLLPRVVCRWYEKHQNTLSRDNRSWEGWKRKAQSTSGLSLSGCNRPSQVETTGVIHACQRGGQTRANPQLSGQSTSEPETG